MRNPAAMAMSSPAGTRTVSRGSAPTPLSAYRGRDPRGAHLFAARNRDDPAHMATMTRRRRRSTYDVLPAWVTTKRVALGVLFAVVATGSVYGVRLSFALAKVF